VLHFLDRYARELEAIRSAAGRPYARFDLRLDQSPFDRALAGKLRALNDLGDVLWLRALARLEAEQDDAAFEDLELLLRLAEYTQPTPFFRGVRHHLLSDALQVVWQGLADRRWQEAQLAELQERLGELAVLGAYAGEARAEILAMINLWDWCFPARSVERPTEPVESGADQAMLALFRAIYPRGWSLQVQVKLYRVFQEDLLPLVNAEAGTVAVDAAKALPSRLRTDSGLLDPIFAVFVLPKTAAIGDWLPVEFAHLQSCLSQARAACALERYRRSGGRYPQTLPALVPEYLAKAPHDAIDGGAMRYERIGQEGFLLYSVGWNQTDDGGQPASARRDCGPPGFAAYPCGPIDLERGDWVWATPER
jgi:hypothetical protein